MKGSGKINKNRNDIWIGFSIFAAELALFYYFWQNNLILTSSLLAVSAVVLFKWSTKLEIFLYFTGFFLGPVYDITLVPTGIWNYGNHILFGIPPWLPGAYGLGAVMIYKIGASLKNIFANKKYD